MAFSSIPWENAVFDKTDDDHKAKEKANRVEYKNSDDAKVDFICYKMCKILE